MAERSPDGVFHIWGVRALDDTGRPCWAALVQSGRHPDKATLDLPEADARAEVGDHAVGIATYGDDGEVARLEVTADSAPKAPPLWFVRVDEPDAAPPATSLVAFTGGDVEPGSLLDRRQAQLSGVRGSDQVGAFRWYPGSGFGDQVYVAPAWRRRTIGTGLLAVAGTLSFAEGWAWLWGDGQRTAEGDRFRSASRWSHMSEDLTHLLAPMTPPEER